MKKQPIVIVVSYPPRLCGIATFAEEAREYIQKANPEREVLVISHIDGEGGVYPIIDMDSRDWWEVVTQQYNEAFELARNVKKTVQPVNLDFGF